MQFSKAIQFVPAQYWPARKPHMSVQRYGTSSTEDGV
jgi:hypothetical protein